MFCKKIAIALWIVVPSVKIDNVSQESRTTRSLTYSALFKVRLNIFFFFHSSTKSLIMDFMISNRVPQFSFHSSIILFAFVAMVSSNPCWSPTWKKTLVPLSYKLVWHSWSSVVSTWSRPLWLGWWVLIKSNFENGVRHASNNFFKICDRVPFPIIVSMIGNVLLSICTFLIGPAPFLTLGPTVGLIQGCMALCGLVSPL